MDCEGGGKEQWVLEERGVGVSVKEQCIEEVLGISCALF